LIWVLRTGTCRRGAGGATRVRRALVAADPVLDAGDAAGAGVAEAVALNGALVGLLGQRVALLAAAAQAATAAAEAPGVHHLAADLERLGVGVVALEVVLALEVVVIAFEAVVLAEVGLAALELVIVPGKDGDQHHVFTAHVEASSWLGGAADQPRRWAAARPLARKAARAGSSGTISRTSPTPWMGVMAMAGWWAANCWIAGCWTPAAVERRRAAARPAAALPRHHPGPSPTSRGPSSPKRNALSLASAEARPFAAAM
jgi:hypothetical protein